MFKKKKSLSQFKILKYNKFYNNNYLLKGLNPLYEVCVVKLT